MHINQLPLELLQKILSYLSYNEHLNLVSFVCHHWLRAVETFVVHRGTFVISEQVIDNWDIVKNLIRCYKVLSIPNVQDWIALRLVVLKCMRGFPEASEMYVDGFRQNLLPRFYSAYRRWEEEQVTNDCKQSESDAHAQTMPDLTRLIWMDCLEYNGAHRPPAIMGVEELESADVLPEVRYGLKRKINGDAV
ncbi:hypothetical protein RP20_CCG020385 [Aedes albopictus]|nr:hypothetical protein RP20_CCG020385 [Aedes albopictus]